MTSTEKKNILIVDDSPLQAIVLRRILTQANFDTLTAKDGEEALGIIKVTPVGLIISDVNMPRMDGYQLCSAIKQSDALCHIPVVLCTILSSPEDLIKGIEVGADSYVTRPYNEDQILKIVKGLMAIPYQAHTVEPREITFEGKKYTIKSSRQHILNFLLSTYLNIHTQNTELVNLREEVQKAYKKLELIQKEQENLLLNILPESVANELIAYGSVQPQRFENTSVMFVDFKGFSKSSSTLSPNNLVHALEFYFDQFDKIIGEFNLERIKTIGDGYMCAAGITNIDPNHAIRCIGAAIEIQKIVKGSIGSIKEKYGVEWNARIGIHSGPVVAGVVGKKRFAYDIWGDTVNIASRMESHGIPGEINISEETYQLIKSVFKAKSRGNIPIHTKDGSIERNCNMYLVEQPSVSRG